MRRLLTLPVPGSGCGKGHFVKDGAAFSAEYEYGEGQDAKIGKLVFDWAIAFRFRNEEHGRGFVPESYDTLIEITESDWLSELRETGGKWRHFAVFFSNIGYLEVVARDFHELPERAGTLS